MKLSNFQIIVVGLFVVFILLGVGVFAAFGGLLGGKSVGPVTIWGTVDSSVMDTVITTLLNQDKSFQGVKYIEKDPSTYEATLINAMASGQGPDLFIVSQDQASEFANKIALIPYGAISQSQFTSSFIDESDIFLTPGGELALPLTEDPLVMYWNRDLFATVGLAQAPQYWDDFLTIAPKLTSLDANANVQRSAVALGLWQNVANAKAILSALFMQAGDAIVTRDSQGALQVTFGQTPAGAPENPAESALRFYTEFANPSKTTYSWNGALPNSSDAFAAGDVGIYFGFASEYTALANRNPNLHFSVALLPQLQGNTNHLTFGQLTGLAIARTSANPQGALTIAEKLTSQQAIGLLAAQLPLPPVRRDVVIDTSSNAALSVFVQSSLIARAWSDPSPAQTDPIFKSMIESVVSGQSEPAGAVATAAQALTQLLAPN